MVDSTQRNNSVPLCNSVRVVKSDTGFFFVGWWLLSTLLVWILTKRMCVRSKCWSIRDYIDIHQGHLLFLPEKCSEKTIWVISWSKDSIWGLDIQEFPMMYTGKSEIDSKASLLVRTGSHLLLLVSGYWLGVAREGIQYLHHCYRAWWIRNERWLENSLE